MRKFVLICLGLVALVFNGPAQASGDYGCTPGMRVFFSSFTGCDSMGLISPGNDTRINLVFLMADARKQKLKTFPPSDDFKMRGLNYTPVDWSYFSNALDFGQVRPEIGSEGSGEGTICVSEEAGRAGFLSALNADAGITNVEKVILTDARKALSCANHIKGFPANAVQSASAKEFAVYLEAINQFYVDGSRDASGFVALSKSFQPWVREAAFYMQARVTLLAGQYAAFDEYGTLKKEAITQDVVATAITGLNSYLKEYPNGTYAASATGLLRRAYLFSGDIQKQAAAYSSALTKSDIDRASIALVSELDTKLPVEAYQDILLLAVQDLRLMRSATDDAGKPLPGMTASVIEAQQTRFAANEDLYRYLLAARAWLVDKDAKAVLQLLPDKPLSAEPLSYLEFSSHLLRAAALEMTGDSSARAKLVVLFPVSTGAYQRSTLELALAMLDERAKNISAVFAPDSLIQQPIIRQQVLDYIAGPILLRQQALATNVSQEERDVALSRLYWRNLTQGRFKGFLEDIKLLPPKPQPDKDGNINDRFSMFRLAGNTEGYSCPDVIEVAKLLNEDSKSIRGRLCLGDFFRINGDGSLATIDSQDLGGTGTLFAGKSLSRQDFYIDIMKSPKALRDEKAYALFRAVRCYEPVHINGCGGDDVSEGLRKKWYNELKSKYGNTSYAKDLRYYW